MRNEYVFGAVNGRTILSLSSSFSVLNWRAIVKQTGQGQVEGYRDEMCGSPHSLSFSFFLRYAKVRQAENTDEKTNQQARNSLWVVFEWLDDMNFC